MKSAILQMYYGERGQNDMIQSTEAHRKLGNEVVRYEEELNGKLAAYPELLGLFKKICNAAWRLNGEDVSLHFAEGFKFGLLMGLEVAGDGE
ncbi:MAG: hypothetical protein LBL66_00555 [Clostridiales bacterium]|jgi:hypothetical protein|nr:hypothetical protein [Clostridiales bacterium]